MAIYFHGWIESTRSQDVLVIREAYVDYNVITVDWSRYAADYTEERAVIPQVKIVSIVKRNPIIKSEGNFCLKIAETFADLLLDFVGRGYDVTNVELVGHSMG
jgi:hypothetical protein